MLKVRITPSAVEPFPEEGTGDDDGLARASFILPSPWKLRASYPVPDPGDDTLYDISRPGDDGEAVRFLREGNSRIFLIGNPGAPVAGSESIDILIDSFTAFGDIFGGGFGDLFGGRRGGRRGPRPGRDLRIVLDLTLEEIETGVERTVALKRFEHCESCQGTGGEGGSKPVTCQTCGGRGQVQRSQGFFTMATPCPSCRGVGQVIDKPCRKCSAQGKVQEKSEVTIRIPAGIEEGVQLRVAGEGDVGDVGAPRGNIFCVIREKPHKVFQRSGPDLMTELPCGFAQLALGDKVEIPTLSGKVELSIPSGTQSGKVLRLRGQGLPSIEGRGRGDLLVRLFVEVPTKLTSRQKELLEEFGQIETSESGHKSFFEKIANYFS